MSRYFPGPAGARESLAEVSEAMDWLAGSRGARWPHRDERPLPRFRRFCGTFATRIDAHGSRGRGTRGLRIFNPCWSCTGTVLGNTSAPERRHNHPSAVGRASTEDLGEFRPLLKQLAGKILPNGEPADDASPGLARIRGKIERHRSLVQEIARESSCERSKSKAACGTTT